MRRFRYILFLLFIAVGSTLVFSQNGSATIELDKSEIKLGEQIEATLQISFPVTESYEFAFLKDTIIKEIEIVELGKIDTNYAGSNLATKVLSRKIILTSFDTGYHALPPVVFYSKTDSAKTEPVLIQVLDVEVDEPKQNAQGELEIEIKDIKDIREADFSIWEWIKMNALWIVLALLSVVGIWAYFKFLHPKLKNRGVSNFIQKKIIPPHQIAVEKLIKLDNQKLWQSGQVKLYQISLSEIVREYIENQLYIPALESTTPEIMETLKSEGFSEKIIMELKDILEMSDLVKFAKHIPLGDENTDSMKKAYHFVQVTKPEEVIVESKTEELSHV